MLTTKCTGNTFKSNFMGYLSRKVKLKKIRYILNTVM